MANDQTPPQPPKKPTLRVQVKQPGLSAKLGKFRPKSPKTRWLLVFGAVAVVGIAVSSLTSSSGPQQNAPQKPKQHFISLSPNGAGEKTWQAQAQSQVQVLHQQMQSMQEQMQQLKQGMAAQTKALESTTQALQNAKTALGTESSTAAKNANSAEQSNMSALPLPPPPPAPTNPDIPSTMPAQTSSGKILEFSPTSATAASPAVASRAHYQRNPYAGYIPAGSFMGVALLNGVDAGTSTETQSNPEPVLMRIQQNAILPGNAHYQLKSCFVIGSAYGSLSSERVYVRAAQISCVDKSNRLVLNQKIQGYIVDSDGVLGLRGKVINRQGALLAKALLAGFASGLGQALSSAQSDVSTSALGSVSTISGSSLLRQSGYTGVGNAATMLAQFYLKQAQSIFPVVAVRAGRKGTLVLTNGESLQWHDYGNLYVREVKPKK